MKIEKTFIKYDSVMYYCITDNVCSLCRHNPKNKNPYMGYDGKCKDANESVVECCNFEKVEE